MTSRETLIRAALSTPEHTCAWTQDDDGNWNTSCDQIHVLIDGTPAENGMRYCCYCGGSMDTSEPSREDDYAGSMTTCEERGPRLVGPHGGLKRSDLPNPSDADLADPLFEAIWQATKTWDVNAPEYYVGYCGMNGSHVMLIVNAIRAMKSEPSREPTQEQVEAWCNAAAEYAMHGSTDVAYTKHFATLAHAAGFEAGRMAGASKTKPTDLELIVGQCALIQVLVERIEARGGGVHDKSKKVVRGKELRMIYNAASHAIRSAMTRSAS